MLDKDGLSDKDQKYHVFHYNHENEFTSSSFLKVEKGTGLPANSTLIPILKIKDGFTQVFDTDKQKWEYVEDHRYKDVWNTETKQKEEVNYIGKIKDGFTDIEPPSYDHDFINREWIITAEKQAEIDAMQKQQRIYELEAEKAQLSTDMNMHLLLDEKTEAKACAERIKEINAEIEKLKE